MQSGFVFSSDTWLDTLLFVIYNDIKVKKRCEVRNMSRISVDFGARCGAIKPMHAVNNGPAYKFAVDQRISNLESYRAAGIPFARTHDAAFYSTYGGEHTVDIHAIFPNFDADPEDPASYDFQLTDEYLRVIELAGTKVFYRLGSKIEHWSKKYGTLPPKDFKKWAVICEHIIRHYNEGWADGYEMGIEYWEIWNEPDLDPDDSTHKRCWGGTKVQFFDLYHIAANHLKQRFPHLKIGGPALACDMNWARDFLAQLKAPLDFFSWHIYASDPRAISRRTQEIRAMLDEYGFQRTESILNEWNYVRGWTGDDWIYSLKTEKSLKGAAFIAATMCLSQHDPLDMLMYYDARPCAMNGMYNTDIPSERLKGYYPFRMFNELYTLNEGVRAESDDAQLFACAAVGADEAAVMIACYDDDDGAPGRDVHLVLTGFGGSGEAEVYLLDGEHDMELIRTERFAADDTSLTLHMSLHSVCLVKLKKT